MSDPGQSFTLFEWLSMLGFKSAAVIGGFFGATVALVGSPRLSPFQLIVSVLGGTATAIYLEPIISYWLGLPAEIQGGVAFILGLGGLILAAGVLEVSRTLPAMVIDFLRRKIGGG